MAKAAATVHVTLDAELQVALDHWKKLVTVSEQYYDCLMEFGDEPDTGQCEEWCASWLDAVRAYKYQKEHGIAPQETPSTTERISIKIDRTVYGTPSGKVFGRTLRKMVNIPDDRDIFLVDPWGEGDVKLLDDDLVLLSEGRYFLTSPRYING